MNQKGYTEFEWEVKESKKGDNTLLLGGRAVYSLYDPIKQVNGTANKLIAKAREEKCDHIIILGSGLGYLPRSLYNSGHKKIIVWEPFPVMQQSFPVCSGEWKESVIIINDYSDFKKSVLQFARKGSRPKLIIHPGYDIFCRLEYRLAIQFLEEIYKDNIHDTHVISQRSLESIVRMPFLRTVKDFEEAFKGKRAILTNPGPSLTHSIHVLKNIDNSIIFSSLQTVPYLQKNGIKVHFVVCANPIDMTLFLADCSDNFDAFLAETSANPFTLEWNRKKTFLFHFRCRQIHELLWEQAQLPVIEDPVATVSEVMLILADYMGFNEIFCIGMDLCWKENRYSYRTRHKQSNELVVNNTMPRFQLLTSDNQIATTQSDYFHAARYMQQKCPELIESGKQVFQMAGGISFNTSGILTYDELNKKIHSGNGKVRFDIEKSQSPITVEQVDNLLKNIIIGKTGEHDNALIAIRLNLKNKLWSFLQDIPVAERSDICHKYINELRRLQNRDS